MTARRGPRIAIKPVCLKCLVSSCEHLTNKPLRLTAREVGILLLLAERLESGCFPSDKDIAYILGISTGVVKTYNSSIYKKLKVDGRLNAALWARDRLVPLFTGNANDIVHSLGIRSKTASQMLRVFAVRANGSGSDNRV